MTTQTFDPTPRPRSSPWDQVDYAEQVAPGIWSVSTPGHGGYMLSPQRVAAMPDYLKDPAPMSRACGCFEEDCEWALVVLAFPDEFSVEHQIAARKTVAMTAGFSFNNFDASPWNIVKNQHPVPLDTSENRLKMMERGL